MLNGGEETVQDNQRQLQAKTGPLQSKDGRPLRLRLMWASLEWWEYSLSRVVTKSKDNFKTSRSLNKLASEWFGADQSISHNPFNPHNSAWFLFPFYRTRSWGSKVSWLAWDHRALDLAIPWPHSLHPSPFSCHSPRKQSPSAGNSAGAAPNTGQCISSHWHFSLAQMHQPANLVNSQRCYRPLILKLLDVRGLPFFASEFSILWRPSIPKADLFFSRLSASANTLFGILGCNSV